MHLPHCSKRCKALEDHKQFVIIPRACGFVIASQLTLSIDLSLVTSTTINQSATVTPSGSWYQVGNSY